MPKDIVMEINFTGKRALVTGAGKGNVFPLVLEQNKSHFSYGARRHFVWLYSLSVTLCFVKCAHDSQCVNPKKLFRSLIHKKIN